MDDLADSEFTGNVGFAKGVGHFLHGGGSIRAPSDEEVIRDFSGGSFFILALEPADDEPALVCESLGHFLKVERGGVNLGFDFGSVAAVDFDDEAGEFALDDEVESVDDFGRSF